jgi:hypothetical protein
MTQADPDTEVTLTTPRQNFAVTSLALPVTVAPMKSLDAYDMVPLASLLLCVSTRQRVCTSRHHAVKLYHRHIRHHYTTQ